MGKKKQGGEKKDKFDSLSESFKDAVAQSTTDEIRKRISEVAILDVTEREVLKNDPDVLSAKEQLKNLMEPYRENLKSYKLQIEFCKRVLDDKGVGAAISRAADKDINKLVETIKNPGKGMYLKSITVGGKTIEIAPSDDAE